MGRELKEKLKTLDEVVTYLARKERVVSSVVATKTPISILYWYVDIVKASGILAFFVAPCAGKIKKVVMAVPGVSKERPLVARIDIVKNMQGQYQGIKSIVPVVVADVDLSLAIGDTVRVVIEDPSFTDIAVSALFQPDFDYAETLNFAIEALEAAKDERIRNATLEIPSDGPESGSPGSEELPGVDVVEEPSPSEGQLGTSDPVEPADPGPTG